MPSLNNKLPRLSTKPHSYLVGVGFLLLIALLAGGKVFYTLFYLALLMVIIPILQLKWSVRGLQVETRLTATKLQVGDSVDVQLHIINSSHQVIPYLEIYTELGMDIDSLKGETKVVSLVGKERRILSHQLQCRRRGVFKLKDIKVTTSDVLNNYSLPILVKGEQAIKVYPRLSSLDDFAINASAFFGTLTATSPMFEDYTRISHLRKWRRGDTVKKIHWKATAKQDELIVKNFELKADTNFRVVLDMSKTSYSGDASRVMEDAAVEFCLALVYTSLQHGIPVSIGINDLQPNQFSIDSEELISHLLEYTVELRANGQVSFDSFVATNAEMAPLHSKLAVVTPTLSASLAAAMLTVSDRVQPLLYLITFAEVDKRQQQLMAKLNDEGISVTLVPVRGAQV